MGYEESNTGYIARRMMTSNYLPVENAEDETVQPFEVECLRDAEGSSLENGKGTDNGISVHLHPELSESAWMRDIWAVQNRAIVNSYISVGFALSFLRTPLTYYLVHELDATPAQQNVLLTLALLPWSFKMVYGFISDSFPVWGMRRKPYFLAGWSIFVSLNLLTATLERPSVRWLAAQGFLSTLGFMFSDVATDAMLVERSKHELQEKRGSMQATAYIVRFGGSIVGSVMGTLLFNKDRWGWGLSISQCFALNALAPGLLVGSFAWQLRETTIVHDRIGAVERMRLQSQEVFSALTQRAVYVPCMVIFLYNVLQVPNAAWRSFLVEGLGFTSYELGLLSICGSLFASAGLLAYKRWFFNTSWRQIYFWATLLVSVFSVLQILLILRVNIKWGISDLAFSLGDDAIADFVQSIQFLPLVQMYISMCPDGAEGTTYAILTTLANVAGAAAYNLGTLATGLWDVSNQTLSEGNFGGMWRLTLLTSLIQPVPLLLIRYLPGSKEEQYALQQCGVRHSWGGVVLLTVLFVSLFWTVVLSLVEISSD